ncbi:hypothetical protein IM792_19370 [Mucilaginibacter sp. JRF]|uniref:capsular polysaccharide synthesis protein n=1 Tax=Mucilaginibacter sp. JRF TaxID=2780088 RepID=UPI0018824AFE|nr:capsular polysaccharide synthesis protein [Mucilaginibacter sp. JRF]MBE9586618.1 hypothetical protein [Mucilaginibacter sp. JRF]
MGLYVWIYWEGTAPEWIKKCRESIFAHAPNVCLISPESFAELRDIDTDIDLSGLYVAHRADYIRAFLLARYGGIWIDADCMLMRSIEPLIDSLKHYDFMGYRERSGEVTNNFMGAPEGSFIARKYYNTVCDILRSGQKLEWLTIGSKALTATINESGLPWHELDVMQVQPICWSNPQAFFKKGSYNEHDEAFEDDAYSYMLSGNMVRGVVEKDAGQDLLADGTFFNFLLVRSKTNIANNGQLIYRN